MTKKAKTASEPKAPLSIAQKYYLEQFGDKKSAEELSNELALPVETINEFLVENNRPTKSKPPTDKFQRHSGTVSMTSSQSKKGDDNHNKAAKAPLRTDRVHKMWQDEPQS